MGGKLVKCKSKQPDLEDDDDFGRPSESAPDNGPSIWTSNANGFCAKDLLNTDPYADD